MTTIDSRGVAHTDGGVPGAGQFATKTRQRSKVVLETAPLPEPCTECGGVVDDDGNSKGFCEDCREEICDADDCTNSLSDGEGWDGYCGECADSRSTNPDHDDEEDDEETCDDCGNGASDCGCIDGIGGERQCDECGDSFNIDGGGSSDDDSCLCNSCED